MSDHEAVKIDGHLVDPALVDRFFSGADGARISDEEWDESKRRLQEHELADVIEAETDDGQLR